MQESTILLDPFLLWMTNVNHGTRLLIPFYSLKTHRLIPALKWIESINFLEDNEQRSADHLSHQTPTQTQDKAKKLSALKRDSVQFSTILERLKA